MNSMKYAIDKHFMDLKKGSHSSIEKTVHKEIAFKNIGNFRPIRQDLHFSKKFSLEPMEGTKKYVPFEPQLHKSTSIPEGSNSMSHCFSRGAFHPQSLTETQIPFPVQQ